MDFPDWKSTSTSQRDKAFWSDMTICQDTETCRTAWWEGFWRSCQDNLTPKDTEKAEALRAFLPLSLLARAALWPPSSARLVAKIWGGQATRGSWQLSEGLLPLDVHGPMVLPTRHSGVLRGLAGAAAKLPKSNQQLLGSSSLLQGRKK